ncbi:hypothetical protein TI39_contig4134g00004 [Zymoseptoria brevis]|uniref:Uncharacterized protein n=1 Tax=Zymoseptoria brevis TaxID=1047168 RepID=A0A0F4GDN2_9PEZI|nr:hypothetical protein TI39_contig4134g00004 [Zymoseptoria brevis]
MASQRSIIPGPGHRSTVDGRRQADRSTRKSLPLPRAKSTAAVPTYTPSTASPMQPTTIHHRSSSIAKLSSFGEPPHKRSDSVLTNGSSRSRPPSRLYTSKSYGLLTPPSSTSSRSSLLYAKDGPSSPPYPVHTSSRSRPLPAAVARRTTSAKATLKPPTSPYMNMHITDPCIPGCLIHQLSPCGHKILTTKPEPCASNCKQRSSNTPSGTPTQDAFVCAACVELHIQVHREVKRDVYQHNLEQTEVQMGKFPPDWLEQQQEFWEKVWENDMLKEKESFERLGRSCIAIPGEPIEEGMGKIVNNESVATAVPWPPIKRPAKVRTSEWRPRVGQDQF